MADAGKVSGTERMHTEFGQWIVDRLMAFRECDQTEAMRIVKEAIDRHTLNDLIKELAELSR